MIIAERISPRSTGVAVVWKEVHVVVAGAVATFAAPSRLLVGVNIVRLRLEGLLSMRVEPV